MSDPVVVTPPAQTTQQAPAVETPPKPPDPQVNPELLREQFQSLTKRERAHLAEKQRMGEEKRAFDEERGKFKAQLDEAERFRNMVERAKTSDEWVKAVYGDDYYQKFTDWQLDKKPPPDLRVDAVKDEVAALRKQIADQKQHDEAEAQRRDRIQQEETIRSFNVSAAEYVKKAGDKYELINALDVQAEVPNLIAWHWNNQRELPMAQRRLLSVDEAAQMVEDRLEKQARIAAKTKRLTSGAGSANIQQQHPASEREARSLSNEMTATSAEAPRPRFATEAEAEAARLKRAFAAFDAARAKNGA